MKAEIKDGNLTIIPENETEDYALNEWIQSHRENECSYLLNQLDLRKDISCGSVIKNDHSIIEIIKDTELSENQKILLLHTLYKANFTLSAATNIIRNDRT
jgi:hypothetical protein